MPKQPLAREEEASFDAAKLYPELASEQQREAAYFLGCYLDIVCRIDDRINNLTADENSLNLKAKGRSTPST